MLRASDRPPSPLNHHQHLSPVQSGGGQASGDSSVLPPGGRACPLLSTAAPCKLDGLATPGLLRKPRRLGLCSVLWGCSLWA